MGVRRNTKNRLTLYRNCGTCGKPIMTTADSPWIRQLPRDGKKQATVYFCSTGCYAASYKNIGWYDGKAEVRRKEKEQRRDIKEKNRRYYEAHREQEIARARKWRAEYPEEAKATAEYNRLKRRLLMEERVNA